MTDNYYQLGFNQGIDGETRDEILAHEYSLYADGWAEGNKLKSGHGTCDGCRFYVIVPSNLKQGTCRRFPPQMSPAMIQGRTAKFSAFPDVKADEFCGEFKGKENVEKS